ncbi:MAG: hypothetical protein CMI12_15040 [Oceanospirillum sp.]|nr:hypothetical protein [Oceanospirillum sp.]
MRHPPESSASLPATTREVASFEEFAQRADYSLMNNLNAAPDATEDGYDHRARQVFSGHFVPVTPTPIADPEYVSHSRIFFNELGLSDELAHNPAFSQMFSGDLSTVPEPMRPYGWATGYALSIYGTEYTQQCPFRTGNGYGDGRAISVFEGEFNGKRWEMQLKGGGPTPYCRGADGRAVLRSSVREFLAQEYMHALGVPTSRSLTLYTSKSETVTRPWYAEGSRSADPDIMVSNPVAISTRVAPSFLRVGQVELFARRARKGAYPHAREELQMIVEHLIEREYKSEIDHSQPFNQQVVELATQFRQRLTALVANWLRVGYCQGNFNSDNCAAGGFTLDYGPFGYCEAFDPEFQPWTGGGRHFSFMNQPAAAEANFHMFWGALRVLLVDDPEALAQLDQVRHDFTDTMKEQMKTMWANKLGLVEFDQTLFSKLMELMERAEVDFTIFFRELSNIPEDIASLKKSFYVTASEQLDEQWQSWLNDWRALLLEQNQILEQTKESKQGKDLEENNDLAEVSAKMKRTNPKYAWREWLVAPAYQQAMAGDYSLIQELQEVFNQPYDEQTSEIEAKYYRLRPKEFFNAGGVSHYSCSS